MPRQQRQRDYTKDYGGPVVPWPEAVNTEPDWTALFPIPQAASLDVDRPSKTCEKQLNESNVKDVSDESSDESSDEADFWLSPRMACMLWDSGCSYVDLWCDVDLGQDAPFIDGLPDIAEPFAKVHSWAEAYRQAAMRVVVRLGKGKGPHPNCTAEEMALHQIMDLARDSYQHKDEGLMELIDVLPCSTKDGDFDLVTSCAFQDVDVLMLYDMPQLANPGNAVAMFASMTNLHPDKWFKPFKPYFIDDHAL